MPTDPIRLSSRLYRERGVYLDPELIDPEAEELDPEHEGNILAEYGFEALVRYYSPDDPRLTPLAEE